MNNYQLYRTNELLGGQLKINIIIGLSSHNKLIVKGFDLSPISNSIPYDRTSDNDLLNYDHQSNIKSYYEKVSKYFFDSCLRGELSSIHPIITDKQKDSHDGTYEMGCRRMNHSIYDTQFEYLCPVWLEKLDEVIGFKFSFSHKYSSSSFYDNSFYLNIIEGEDLDNDEIFHNKFVNYFYNYIKYLGIDSGNDEVLNVNLNDKISTISGIDVESGQYIKKDLLQLSSNLTEREIPKLLFDEKIIDSFPKYNMVACQLFNFNICFNIEDLLPKLIYDEFYKHNCYISLKTVINEKSLELRDFYSNYEHIPKKICGGKGDVALRLVKTQYSTKWITEQPDTSNDNVLDYFYDHMNIDTIYKNKISQPIIHWSLNDDNNYIFNIYEGFSGVNSDGDNFYRNHFYDNTPDIQSKSIKYDKQLNNDEWCNHIRLISSLNKEGDNFPITLLSTVKNFIKDFNNNEFDNLFSVFGNSIVNGIYYNSDNMQIKCLLVDCGGLSSTDFESLFGGEGLKEIDGEPSIGFIMKDDKICFFTYKERGDDYYPFTYRKMISIMSELKDNIFEYFCKALTNYKELKKITFDKSLYPLPVESPIITSKEIQYKYDNSSQSNYVMRYDGRIKPTFLNKYNDVNYNYIYYKKLFSTNGEDGIKRYNNSEFAKYNYNTKLSPLYPSVNYFSLDKFVSNYDSDNVIFEILKKSPEFHWFEKSKILVLEKEFNVVLSQNGENGYKKMNELVEEYLADYYNITNDKYKQYILSLYDFESSFDYKYIDNINEYEYYMNIKLK